MNDNELNAARLLLDKLGIQPQQLIPRPRQQTPTIDAYIPIVAAAVPRGARTTYQPYWNQATVLWAGRRLDDIHASDIGHFTEHVRSHATQRRNTRDGRSAAEHAIAALRCLYRHAIADQLLTTNPAAHITKPRRLTPTRTALSAHQLTQIHDFAATTGNDPALDTLLLRLHTETACRRGGALGLRPTDLDPEQCLIRLREKGGTVRWQPVSPTLMGHLRNHNQTRALTTATDQPLLRYADGRSVTRRRYDHLWHRIGQHLPWVATQQVTIHWLRHTTLTWVERHYGHAIARAYAGHTTPDNPTDTYTRATIIELAIALSTLTGEPHPLINDGLR